MRFSRFVKENIKLPKSKKGSYGGREVTLYDPIRLHGENSKFRVYVEKDNKIKKLEFGDPNSEIKRDDPKRKKAFWDRFDCENVTDFTTKSFWSCHWGWGDDPLDV